jgi:hypothetical protein
MDADRQNEILQSAVRLLSERCPRLVRMCYWAGTSSIAAKDSMEARDLPLKWLRESENSGPGEAE